MARTVRIGLLVASAVVILMITIFSLGAEQRFWERKVQYEIHYQRTGGLQEGSQVSLNGVLVGSVVEMRFPADPAINYVQVLVNVRGDVAPRIREDTWASIRTYGLLGDRYIELSAGSPHAAPIPPGGLIQSADPTDIEALVGRGGDIVTNIVEVTAALKDVLGSIQRGEGLLGALLRNRELGEGTLVDLERTMAHVESTTKSLDRIIERVDKGEGVLGQLTGDTREAKELTRHIQRAARAADEFGTRLSRGQGMLGKLVEDEAYARRVLGNLDKATADLATVTEKLAHGQGTLGKLVHDPSLYDDAKGLVGRARQSWLLRLMGGGGSGEKTPEQGAPSANTPAPR
ncbi:MAG TPA: MlaD family protein [Candidatus Binatia bacterium]|nr:MlaD family protein [Candidatus Binatia bacterium]